MSEKINPSRRSAMVGTAVAAAATALAAVAVIGWLFTQLGYVANATQSAGSQAGIVWLMSFIPAAFAALAVLIMCFYNLDNAKLVQVQAELEARKNPHPQ